MWTTKPLLANWKSKKIDEGRWQCIWDKKFFPFSVHVRRCRYRGNFSFGPKKKRGNFSSAFSGGVIKIPHSLLNTKLQTSTVQFFFFPSKRRNIPKVSSKYFPILYRERCILLFPTVLIFAQSLSPKASYYDS